MAIVGDRRKRFQKEIDRLESQQDTAAKMVTTLSVTDAMQVGVQLLTKCLLILRLDLDVLCLLDKMSRIDDLFQHIIHFDLG